jgi:hypothetical protein
LLVRRKSVVKMARRRREAIARPILSHARQTTRTRQIHRAQQANEQVLVAVRGSSPREAIWEGACPEREYYFEGNLPDYKQSLSERRTPPLTSRIGKAPRVGTRRPCRC